MRIVFALIIMVASATAADAGWRYRCAGCAPVYSRPARAVAVTPAPVAVGQPVQLQRMLEPYWQCAILPGRRGWRYREVYRPVQVVPDSTP